MTVFPPSVHEFLNQFDKSVIMSEEKPKSPPVEEVKEEVRMSTHSMHVETPDTVPSFLKQVFDNQEQVAPYLLIRFYQFSASIVLKNCFFTLLHNVLLSTNVDKITQNIYEIVNVIIAMLNRKSKHYNIIVEAVTDLFAILMENAHNYIVKNYRKEVAEMFFDDEFFKTSSLALRNWTTIIHLYMNHEKEELIEDIFYKWNTSAGMFTSKKFETA